MYVSYESRHRNARISYFVNDSRYHTCTSGSYYQLQSRIYAEHALPYAMAANAGVVKAIGSFYRIDTESAFEQFRSRIPINYVNTVHALKKQLAAFLGLIELPRKFGLDDFLTSRFSEWHRKRVRKTTTLHYHGRPVEAGTTKLAGWQRTRTEQYVF